MPMPTIKTIPISAYPPEAWQIVLGVGETMGTIGPHAAYARVPIVYRCVRLRAKALQRIPVALMKGTRDVTEELDYGLLLVQLTKLLYQFEASLCVYAAAYALKQTGRLTGTPHLRWVTSRAIAPQYDADAGLTGFKRQLQGGAQTLNVDDVVYSWLPVLDQDIGPGVAPVTVALRAAGVLDNLDTFLEGFFDRGALRVTLLTVEGNPPEREIQKLETWWRKVVSGVKNAFASVGVRANVKPVTIGDSLTDTVDVALSDAKTMQVLEAMEVPASIALPGAANYATARQDWLNFYEATILPEADLVVMALNEQWLQPTLGLTLELHPERLEVFQSSELDKASALMALAGTPILTQSEARSRLELSQIAPDAQEQQLIQIRSMLEVVKLAKDAGLDPYAVAPLVGLSLPEPPPPPATPAPPMIEAAFTPEQQATEEIAMQRSVEMARWQRKAIKRGGVCSFQSVWIAPDDISLIEERLTHLPVHQAFKLDPPGVGLSGAEQRLYDALVKLLSGYERTTIAQILDGGRVDLEALAPDLRAAFIADLTSIALDAALTTASSVGPDFDPAAAQTAAGEWARAHAGETIQGITETTRTLVGQAVATYAETPGMSRAQLTALLQGAFGERRAETIAITEATRASAQGALMTQAHLAQFGLSFARVWQTVKQEVCPICEPLDGKLEGDGWTEPPPAHPRCRCALSLKRRKE